MSLRECKVCKTLYDDETFIGTTEICHSCRMRLESTYGRIHNHIREHRSIDIARIMDDTGTTPAEMEIILELGWLERDIQTYTGTVSERQKLAREFEEELAKMIDRKKMPTYGGANRRYRNRRAKKNNREE